MTDYDLALAKLDERPPLWEHLLQEQELLRALLLKDQAWDDADPDAFERAELAAKAVLRKFVGRGETDGR